MAKVTKKFELDQDAIKEAIVYYLTQQDVYLKASDVRLNVSQNYVYGDQPTGTYSVSATASE